MSNPLKKLLTVFLVSFLILGTIPLNAFVKPSKKDLDSNPEKAQSITETFFDGKKPQSPGVSPSAVVVPPAKKHSQPLLLAQSLDDYHRLNKCFGEGKNCPSLPKSSPPRKEPANNSTEGSSSGQSHGYPDSSKDQWKKNFEERAQVCGTWEAVFGSKTASECAQEQAQQCDFTNEYSLKLDSQEIETLKNDCNEKSKAASKRHAQEEAERDQAYNSLSGAGKFGFWATIALSLAVFTGGAALAGYFGALAAGSAYAGLIAAFAGLGGLLLGLIPSIISYNSPGSFHEVLGNTLLTPLQIPYSIVSGLLNFLSLGHLGLPDPDLSPFMSKLHKATQKASTAIALAGGATLGFGALGVPYLASAAAFIPSPIAIGAGIYAGANLLYRGGKAIYNRIQDNKRQSQEKELDTLSHEIGNLHEQLDSLKRELYRLGVTKLPTIKTETPRPPDNPGKNASLEERLLWNKQVRNFGQEYIQRLRDFKEQKQKTEEARERVLKRLKEIYPQETVAQGAHNSFHYTIPELLSSGKPLADPETAGLASYGQALLPESHDNNTKGPLFSLWGPPRKQGIPVTGDYLEPRGDSTHKGTDFGAPKGTAIVVNQESQVLFARNTQEHCQQQCRGNRGDMVVLAYGHPTREKGSFGMYTHLGWKNVERNPDGTTKKDTNNVIQGQDDQHSGISVQEGEALEPYRIIGVVGNTGHVTTKSLKGDGSHLHYQHVEYSEERVRELKSKWEKELGEARIKKDKERAKKLEALSNDLDDTVEQYQKLISVSSQDKPGLAYQFLNNPIVQEYFTLDPVKVMRHP